MEIAVLGMGHMGRALAGRLLDGGHQVKVWNRSKGRAGEVVSEGAREAASVPEVRWRRLQNTLGPQVLQGDLLRRYRHCVPDRLPGLPWPFRPG